MVKKTISSYLCYMNLLHFQRLLCAVLFIQFEQTMLSKWKKVAWVSERLFSAHFTALVKWTFPFHSSTYREKPPRKSRQTRSVLPKVFAKIYINSCSYSSVIHSEKTQTSQNLCIIIHVRKYTQAFCVAAVRCPTEREESYRWSCFLPQTAL